MIIADHAHLHIAAATHPGMKGKANEDRYLVTAYRSSVEDPTPSVLAVLADGIGGHRAGEVAAQLAVDNINKFVANSPTSDPPQVLQQAFVHTNQLILNFAAANPALAGMGTTCVCAWVLGDQLYAVSMGDSRLYLLRGDKLYCLTTDHTWIQEALANGALTQEQARGHPNAHIIRRFLGSTNSSSPDLRLRLHPDESDPQSEANQGLSLLPGDCLLLCTDGLTDLVSDAEILDTVNSRPIEDGPSKLVDLANQRGGHDNITVVTMRMPPAAQDTQSIPKDQAVKKVKKEKYRPRTAVSWWMIGMLLVAIISMLLLLLYLSRPF